MRQPTTAIEQLWREEWRRNLRLKDNALWIALKEKDKDFVLRKMLNYANIQRFFYGKEVVVKINDKQTIYELTIDKTEKIYSYEDMIDMYKNNYISESIC